MRENGAKSFKAAAMVGGAVLSAMLGAYGQAQTAAWTTADDHRSMLEQLGIQTLRPGRNADASKPNAANYDEALANPYPILPDLPGAAEGGGGGEDHGGRRVVE